MNSKELKIISASDQETIRIGRNLAACLEKWDVVGLVGELGSGKTWFSKGLIQGLGVRPGTVVTSPTFALVNDYQGSRPGADGFQESFTVYHMDLYRLNGPAEWVTAGLAEYFDQGEIVIIEWAERWPEILPPEAIRVYFTIQGEQERELRIVCNNARYNLILKKMTELEKKNNDVSYCAEIRRNLGR